MPFESLVAVAAGRSPSSIVVMAHRDNTGAGAGANDNASGTAALIELARSYANPAALSTAPSSSQRVRPAHTLVFLSTDGGALGGIGAARFAEHSPLARNVVAVIDLDAIAGRGLPRLEFAGERSRISGAGLLATAAARILEQQGRRPERPSALHQAARPGVPLQLLRAGAAARARNLCGHADVVGRPAAQRRRRHARPPSWIPARPDRPGLAAVAGLARRRAGTRPRDVDVRLLRRPDRPGLGNRARAGGSVAAVSHSGRRPVRAHTPATPAARARDPQPAEPDCLLAVGRRALRSARPRRLLASAPGFAHPHRRRAAARIGRLLGLGILTGLSLVGWLVARERLMPRRRISLEDELTGHCAALLALAMIALLTVSLDTFALVFLLPSLHAWLWLAQLHNRPLATRLGVWLAGFAGPALLLWEFADRFGLGMDAPWYLLQLVALGRVPLVALALVVVWAASAGSARRTGRRKVRALPQRERTATARPDPTDDPAVGALTAQRPPTPSLSGSGRGPLGRRRLTRRPTTSEARGNGPRRLHRALRLRAVRGRARPPQRFARSCATPARPAARGPRARRRAVTARARARRAPDFAGPRSPARPARTRGPGSRAPCSASTAGRTNSSKHTSDDTGLPGRPNTSVSPRTPNEIGFPGFTATRQKISSTPSSLRFRARGRVGRPRRRRR